MNDVNATQVRFSVLKVFLALCVLDGVLIAGAWALESIGVLETSLAWLITVPLLASLAVLLVPAALLHGRLALTIDRDGFQHHAPLCKVGRLAWSEVEALRPARTWGLKLIAIDLKDPDAFLARQRPSTRSMLEKNIRLVGTPMTLSSLGMDRSREQLIDEMQRQLDQSRARE